MRRNPGQGRRSEQGNVLVFVTLALRCTARLRRMVHRDRSGLDGEGPAPGRQRLGGAGGARGAAGSQRERARRSAGRDRGGAELRRAEPLDRRADHDPGAATSRPEAGTRTTAPSRRCRARPTPSRCARCACSAAATTSRTARSPTVLGRIFGVDDIPIAADAIGYIGWAGLMPAGTALLPIALDCCKITGRLLRPELLPVHRSESAESVPARPTTDNPGKIGELPPVPRDGRAERLLDGARLGRLRRQRVRARGHHRERQPGRPSGAKPIYVDNGTKTPVLKEIQDRFLDRAPTRATRRRRSDTNGNGTIDSWLVPLPIVECQNPGAAAPAAAPRRSSVWRAWTFRKSTGAPDKIIKAEYVCPGDPRFDASKCGVGFGPGGEVPTIDAQYPVLVGSSG